MTGLAGLGMPEFHRLQNGEAWQVPADATGLRARGVLPEDRGGAGRRKLLIIDDQVGMTRVVAMMASQLGLEVKVLHDSLHAVDTYLEFRPDILILDMIMPEK